MKHTISPAAVIAACDRLLAELGPLEMSVHADIIGLAGRIADALEEGNKS